MGICCVFRVTGVELWDRFDWSVEQGFRTFVRLRPSFSAHVRWGERGAPVQFFAGFCGPVREWTSSESFEIG
jgi:hypothetical protein